MRLSSYLWYTLIFLNSAVALSAENIEQSRFAEARGKEIFELDQVAWLATDAVSVDNLRESNAQGWVTAPDTNGWKVFFISSCENSVCVPYEVAVGLNSGETEVTHHVPSAELPEELKASWLARQLAFESRFNACTPNYNSVVIPENTSDGLHWVVYLLAASSDPDEVVLTGHHRVTVSTDGTRILESKQLFNSCIINGRTPGAGAIALTHIVDPWPIETHVFTNLSYGVPLYLGTDSGKYAIENGKIRFLAE